MTRVHGSARVYLRQRNQICNLVTYWPVPTLFYHFSFLNDIWIAAPMNAFSGLLMRPKCICGRGSAPSSARGAYSAPHADPLARLTEGRSADRGRSHPSTPFGKFWLRAWWSVYLVAAVSGWWLWCRHCRCLHWRGTAHRQTVLSRQSQCPPSHSAHTFNETPSAQFENSHFTNFKNKHFKRRNEFYFFLHFWVLTHQSTAFLQSANWYFIQ